MPLGLHCLDCSQTGSIRGRRSRISSNAYIGNLLCFVLLVRVVRDAHASQRLSVDIRAGESKSTDFLTRVHEDDHILQTEPLGKIVWRALSNIRFALFTRDMLPALTV